jgi:colanic acid/amylovoran biosynthesis glycosyltransferase
VEAEGRYDTCPVTISEAMAHSMAIVATRHGGIPEEVIDGESGFLVEEYDTPALANRIVGLAKDATLRNRLGQAAWLRAKEMFCPAKIQAQWIQLLQLGSSVRVE